MHASNLSLIGRCLQCPIRQKNCEGACHCTVDGRDIQAHAADRYCPTGRYELGLGDQVASILERTGAAKLWRLLSAELAMANVLWRADQAKPPDCGCAKRQRTLNKLAPSRQAA